MFKIGQFSDWCFQDFFTYYLTKTKTKLHTYLDQILGLFLTKRKILKERTLTFSRKLFWINHFTHQTSTIIVSADFAVNIIVFFLPLFTWFLNISKNPLWLTNIHDFGCRPAGMTFLILKISPFKVFFLDFSYLVCIRLRKKIR